MTTYDVGDGVSLRHTVYDGNGALVAADVSVVVTAPDQTTLSPDVNTPSVGVFEADEFIVDQPGVWLFRWNAEGLVHDVTDGAFAVAGTGASDWATPTEVFDISGELVTVPQLKLAQGVVALHVGRTPLADDAASPRDLYWLKQATAWQAAWQKDQPGYTSRSLVQRVQQDGAGFDYAGQAAVSLAPLAIRAIRNLSWIGGHRVLSLGDAPVGLAAFNVEASDDQHPWRPL